MKWLNTLRRCLGMAEKPPAVSNHTSILFVLQAAAPKPMTLRDIHKATQIPYGELRIEMDRLEVLGRVQMEREALDQVDAYRRYWIANNKGV